MKGDDGFYTDNTEDASNDARKKIKIDEKGLVLCTISEAGISRLKTLCWAK